MSFSQNTLEEFNKLNDSISRNFFNLEKNQLLSLIEEANNLKVSKGQDSIDVIISKLYGNYHYANSEYEKAMDFWVSAAKGFEKFKDSLGASKTYNNISLILNSTKEYKKSIELKKKALVLCPERIDSKWHTTLLQNVAHTYSSIKEQDSFSRYINIAYNKARKYGDSSALGTISNTLATNYLDNGNFKKAIAYCDSVQTIYKDYVRNPVYENSLYFSSVALYETERYSEALEKASQSLNSILKSGMIINAADTYKHIGKIHQRLGNKDKAIEAFRRVVVFKDSIFGIEKQRAVLELEKKYETEKKEKENLELKQQTIEKDLSISQKNNIILISSLIFGLIIISLIGYQLKKFRNKNKALQASIEQREKAEKELETVRDNISKDFHDDLGNRLARITSLSDLILTTSSKRDKENVLSAIEKIKEDSDILYSGTRDFMFSLKAKSDYTEELFTYLSDFGEEFFQSFEIDFFVTKKMDRNVKLPYYWNRQIIMIFKEAMTNIAKHSKAKSVELEMSLDENDLSISLKDNGKGFDVNKLKRKSGLLNMTSRARKINTTLHIVSDENGTSVNFDALLPK